MKIIKKRAMSLIEVLIAMFFLSVAVLSYFVLNQISNKGTMDAYYEMLAYSLAREPIEIYRGLGYDYLNGILFENKKPPDWYPINCGLCDITIDPLSDMQYPAEAALFQRSIDISRETSSDGIKGINIVVVVSAKGQSKAERMFGNRELSLESFIMESPK